MERARMKSLVVSIIKEFDREQADDAAEVLVRLFHAPLREVEPPAAAAPRGRPRGKLKLVHNDRRRAFRAPPPLPADGPQLVPTGWYSIAEAERFLGLKQQMVRKLLAQDSTVLIHRRSSDPDGHIEILGSGIIATREKRAGAAARAE